MNTVLLFLIFIFKISPKNCRGGGESFDSMVLQSAISLCFNSHLSFHVLFVFGLLSRREDGSISVVLGLERQGQLRPMCCRGAVSLSEGFKSRSLLNLIMKLFQKFVK